MRAVRLRYILIVSLCLLFVHGNLFAVSGSRYVDFVDSEGSFGLVQNNEASTVYIDSQDYPGVIRAAKDLQADINRVTKQTPNLVHEQTGLEKNTVIIGTIGKSPVIDRLIKDGKIDTSQIAGKWESFLIQVVPNPMPGVENSLIIAGSDKRGTIYGIYDLSEQIGVSPWYWWADVPVEHKDSLFVKAGKHIQGPPAVKYRGIFINDEGWALSPWVEEKFGGFNHEFYVHVFELLLRLKANHLWPGMWGKYFGDDPNNPKLADEYGIVMGSAHCEPLLFNNDRGAGKWTREMGPWNYETNRENICKVLDKTVSERGQYENVYTVGLRGVHDTQMVGGVDVNEQVALLEQVFKDQRDILAKYIDKKITDIPQVFIPYKEVQDYYDSGLKVPDDVTIMWSDDNWGNIRRLFRPDDKPWSGRGGVYYHYDFHGGPRSYEWLNTSPIPRTWEQMHLAFRHGADRVWIVNVGDIKPMEFPISFFLDYAWAPDKLPAECLPDYTRLWAQQQFGPKYAEDIADILRKYTKYNGRRKPEMVAADTYSLSNYREWETIVADYKKIAQKAEKIYNDLPAEYKDAYYQLVLYPTAACANLNELYVTVGKNSLYAKQGRAATGDMAKKVEELFNKDAELSNYYNKVMANGKWNHIMDTTHIGYTSWNPPRRNNMPKVDNVEVPEAADMGVAIEGSDKWWPNEQSQAVLPEFDPFNQQKYYIEVFNRGTTPFDYSVESGAAWLNVAPNKGKIDDQQRLWVSVDFRQAPTGLQTAPITITGPNESKVFVQAVVKNPASPKPDKVNGFVEANGYVSMEAAHYSLAVEKTPIEWQIIPDLGRTLSGITPMPVTTKRQKPEGDCPRLEYNMYLFSTGTVKVSVYVSPTQNFLNTDGLHYAVSFDDQKPQIVNIHEKDTVPDWKYPPTWNQAVSENIKVTVSEHNIEKAGEHTLKFWMMDPGIVLQKIVVDTGGVKPSYLGPPESYYAPGSVNNNPGTDKAPDSGSGAFITGKYRNLFAENGYSEKDVTEKINSAFQQLFAGDTNTETVYYPAGSIENGPLAYICDINNNDVRSEGMSYGMMIAVQLDKKKQFDALWNWARTYMYHDEPGHPGKGYFAWSLSRDGKPNDDMPAPDGEEYFAMSLYFASGRWGNGTGIYNYQAEADRILDDMKNRKVITGQTARGSRTAGSIFDPEHKMVRFSPVIRDGSSEGGVNRRFHTDPSYHLPAFYELWALWGPDVDRSFWSQAARISRDFFLQTTHPETSLAPDYANFDGTPVAGRFGRNPGNFQFDAWRTAMNWAFDWAWWAKDERQRQLSDHLQAFFESKGISDYGNQFTLDGKQLADDHSTGLVAMNAAASLAATHERAKKFVEELWNTPVPSGHYRYYDGMLYLLGMLHCSGQYRIWTPQ